ncbi:glyoxylase-like metal-dependent hydrolase (beta-lactamase superfamily II) [Roseibium hamelinense]|uniref:Glyoxylase-like metal-dependent hydrolase (Beta-lactamase superfamily II) n=1 Tax=Roseibium hamelinense TaxID=150831 RepID=A0A562SZL0_9HYPH|nr:MBL fold metallo-hydrolase [Roseibium hamelinense]MTI43663.1 MBL fold metallo-hydrolase [Roseibium hamelinense]TWI86180.1 glyoxylase-like metal-dependent hydrolase (beta-lactamase superfamily II) [Roseibium hamelinense]
MNDQTSALNDQAAADAQPPIQILIIPVTPFQQNCSLVWDPKTRQGAVIDPGGDVDTIMSAISEHGVVVEKIVLTHGHIDHVGGAADLAERLSVPVEGPHVDDKELITRVSDQARQFGLADVRPVVPDLWLNDGDRIQFAGREFEVYHCPGHAPGHVVFFDRDLRIVFSGDVLFAGSIGRTDLPGGDHETLISSVKNKLFPLGDDVSFVPGHGPASTIGHERETNPFLK